MRPKLPAACLVGLALLAMGFPRPAAGVDRPDAADPVAEKVSRAEAEYERGRTAARAPLLAAIDARVRAETAAGRLDAVERATAAKRAFEDADVLPTGDPALRLAVAKYESAIAAQQKTLAAAYDAAVVAYTKAGRINEAKAVRDLKSAMGGSAPDARQWHMAVWDAKRGAWVRREFAATAVAAGPATLRLTNADRSRPFAHVSLNDPIDGDFDLSVEYRGAGGVAIRDAQGRDAALGTVYQEKADPSAWHTVRMTRRGGTVSLFVDGRETPVHVEQAMPSDAPGVLCFPVRAGESVEIQKFRLKRFGKPAVP